ncbi:tRNA lysidine(34) synthetase TilS [Fredinandcohnia quinoae]|uniref:tRNA(Ile)-lysidine synthase n=1 Tax=Fredinandcohnia quinoae TaxID=2918902 RepID=A0AAW5EAA9_9BACI|nr:tRNA lysidine(34) synthetase TilS [Fredinandcohnia sp. SECRCQ15]MCH1626922.1 tRNA lysidine(34) synthetase TilS [Fredinandcohnia sp. SECRCQ15]
MIEKVNLFIKKNNLIEAQSTIIVGVSGGPDSLALLHYLYHFQKGKWKNLIAVHVDHMFRGKQSEEDLLFVKDYCNQLGIQFEAAQIDVTTYQQEHHLSTQVAARECRYQFLEEIMYKYNADYLALGHHGDDQVETILMRLVRGSKGNGYAGMQVVRPFACGSIIRPFLLITKDDIESYCTRFDLYPRRDPSNDKDDYTRNRFRHHVLPFLKQENSSVHEHFQQFSEQVIEDNQLLDELTVAKMNTVMKRKEDKQIEIKIDLFLSMPKSLQRRGIQLILNYLYKDIPSSLSSNHIDNLLTLLKNDHPSGELHFPKDLKIIRSYNSCFFTYDEEKRNTYRFQIDESGNYKIMDGSIISTQMLDHFPQMVKGNDFFIIDPDTVKLPLYVRTRKQGDKMTLKGMNGSKKVKDIFIDNKISIHKRDVWPIVEDSRGDILWLPGLKKSSFEANCMTKTKYIVLQYKSCPASAF